MEDRGGRSIREKLGKYQDDSNLRKETILKHWPKEKSFISVNDLVNDGFYCTGQGDRVQCCYCGGILSSWERNDTVHDEHSRVFGQCPLIKNPYKCPDYADKLPRIHSFNTWPHQLKQKPEELAHAGFFYLGLGDKTKCFWCSGILCDWEDADRPMIEHIKWFSECPWMHIMNDKEFIENTLKQHNEVVLRSHTSGSVPAEERVKSMGFEQKDIDKAVKKLGRSVSVGTLVAAILEVEETLNTGASPRDVPPRPESGQFMDIKSLKRENIDMRERSNCKICRHAEVNVVFIPCGHMVCCFSCSQSLQKCPVCRQDITRSVKVFW